MHLTRKAVLVSAAAFSSLGLAASPKNVVLIMTDQQTASALSCAGNPYLHTPAMDSLAADGVRFTRTYCSYPVSGPCRTSIITGRIPFCAGVRFNADRPVEEALDEGIGHVMSDAGYECLYAGKWHVPEVNLPEEGTGFRKLCNMKDTAVPAACDKALDGYDGSKPLFLVASFLDPHEICEYGRGESLPYGPVAYDGSPLPKLPANHRRSKDEPEALMLEKMRTPRYHDTCEYTSRDWRMYLWTYYRLVERVDSQVGQVVKTLKDHGLYDDALIIFLSDHGDGAAAHEWNQKWALWEECVNVPLIVKMPGSRQGSVNEKALVTIGPDIYATLCDCAGVQPDPQKCFGKSLLPVLEGSCESAHEDVYIETRFEGVEMQGWAVAGERYKYVLYQWGERRECLYDLLDDPGETRNLAGRKQYAETLSEMRSRLRAWAVKVGNPACLKNTAY